MQRGPTGIADAEACNLCSTVLWLAVTTSFGIPSAYTPLKIGRSRSKSIPIPRFYCTSNAIVSIRSKPPVCAVHLLHNSAIANITLHPAASKRYHATRYIDGTSHILLKDAYKNYALDKKISSIVRQIDNIRSVLGRHQHKIQVRIMRP